jgi:hypothetical protein
MSRFFSKRAKRIYLILFLIFVVLFLFRLGYGYTLKVDGQQREVIYFDNFSSDNKKNYASDDFKMDKGYSNQQVDIPATTSQKYEKIAKVEAESSNFDSDEKIVKNEVEKNFGIIQYERKTGNDGFRRVQLQIGVPPANFDTLYHKLEQIGYTHSKEIIKNDKTNDYLELNARKASLEKTLASIIQFKEKGGKIDEYINLENRILEIQEKLQQLGVNLGDFDESNAFCTIQFSLAEVKKVEGKTISFYHRVKVALEWTIKMYLGVLGILLLIAFGTFFILLSLEKKDVVLNLFKKEKSNE